MSKLIGRLLDANPTEFRHYVEKLEHASIRPGVDIRLNAEVITKIRSKIKELGLDIHDTTPKELFYGLKSKLAHDEEQLIKILGIDPTKLGGVASILASTATNLSGNERSLSLTVSGVKKILKAVPPKRTMKMLKYRSIDSVLKRDDPRVLYMLACFIEGRSWSSQVHAKMKRLDSRDIAWQKIACVYMPPKWYKKTSGVLSDQGLFVVNPEAGVVCVLPVIEEIKKGMIILALALVLQSIQRLAEQSLPYKRHGLTRGYTAALPEIAHGVKVSIHSIHGLRPTWGIVYELIRRGSISTTALDVDFELNEMSWRSVEMKIASLLPEFDYWVDTHYLAMPSSDRHVSMHLVDIALALTADSEFGQQSTSHMEGSLWNELQIRYLQEDSLNHSLVSQLLKGHHLSIN